MSREARRIATWLPEVVFRRRRVINTSPVWVVFTHAVRGEGLPGQGTGLSRDRTAWDMDGHCLARSVLGQRSGLDCTPSGALRGPQGPQVLSWQGVGLDRGWLLPWEPVGQVLFLWERGSLGLNLGLAGQALPQEPRHRSEVPGLADQLLASS